MQSSAATGNCGGLLNLPQQVLGLPPGSPSTPLFMLNDNSNHSLVSLPSKADIEDEESEVENQVNETNTAAVKNGSRSGSSKSKTLYRQLSFLTSEQAKELEANCSDEGSSTFTFMGGGF